MLDYSESAREELKRVDHLIYVSLKYTRTVDVIKSIIDRLISACNFAIVDLLEHSKDKIEEDIPESPAGRASLIKKLFNEQENILEFIAFYLHLRKLSRSEYDKINEFRRHVTMIANVGDKTFNIDIDTISEYFNRVKAYLKQIDEIVLGLEE
jgi:hypothetical protein